MASREELLRNAKDAHNMAMLDQACADSRGECDGSTTNAIAELGKAIEAILEYLEQEG